MRREKLFNMEYTSLLEQQIIGRLRIDNPWWTENEVPAFYREMRPRMYLDIFYPLVTDLSLNRSIVLMGPRRVGKTVMLFHTIQKLYITEWGLSNCLTCVNKL